MAPKTQAPQRDWASVTAGGNLLDDTVFWLPCLSLPCTFPHFLVFPGTTSLHITTHTCVFVSGSASEAHLKELHKAEARDHGQRGKPRCEEEQGTAAEDRVKKSKVQRGEVEGKRRASTVGPRADSGPEKTLVLTRLEGRPDPSPPDSLIRPASQTKTKEGQWDNVIGTTVRVGTSGTLPVRLRSSYTLRASRQPSGNTVR